MLYGFGELLRSYFSARRPFQASAAKADAFAKDEWNTYLFDQELGSVLSAMRKDIFRVEETIASKDSAQLFVGETNPCTLDGLVKFDVADLNKEAKALEISIVDFWTIALDRQTLTVQTSSCEGWTAHLDDVIAHPEICKALVLNPAYKTLHQASTFY